MKLDYLKEAKEKAINEILNSDMDKLTKLKTIEDNGLWGYSKYINHEFSEWEEEAKELERTTAEENNKTYHSKMTDSIFDPSTFMFEKYESVSYVEALNRILKKHKTDLVPVITTRNPVVSLYKTKEEIINTVYDFCVENKIIGFENDW